MKRKSCFFILGLIFLLSSAIPAAAENYYYDYYKIVKLVIGEKQAQVNEKGVLMDQAAYIVNGRTLVPFRFLGESLGAEVLWDARNSQATLILGAKVVKVTIGSKVALVNEQLTTLDVAPETKGGRTFIPLRFVSEALGAYVDYIPAAQMIKVRYVIANNWLEKEYNQNITYSYPANWTVRTGDSGAGLIFTSPNGAELALYGLDMNPADAIALRKKVMAEDGYSLDSEGPIYENDPDAGTLLIFSEPVEDDRIMNYFYIYDSEDDGSFIEDEFMYDSDADMEWAVMDSIINSYH